MSHIFEIERDPRVAEIAAAAREILEERGREGLTMRAIGEALGIKAPSLYKHVADKEEIEALLAADALLEIGVALRAALAGRAAKGSKERQLVAIARAYRATAHASPHLYRLATEGELPRDQLPNGLEAWSAMPLVEAAGGEHQARAVWAFAHGMTILELDNRFPPGAALEKAWSAGISGLASA